MAVTTALRFPPEVIVLRVEEPLEAPVEVEEAIAEAGVQTLVRMMVSPEPLIKAMPEAMLMAAVIMNIQAAVAVALGLPVTMEAGALLTQTAVWG